MNAQETRTKRGKFNGYRIRKARRTILGVRASAWIVFRDVHAWDDNSGERDHRDYRDPLADMYSGSTWPDPDLGIPHKGYAFTDHAGALAAVRTVLADLAAHRRPRLQVQHFPEERRP